MTPITLTPANGSLPMTVLSIFSRLRNDMISWWEKRSYQPEKRYMRGTHDA